MTKKSIFTSILLSMVAVSMVACSQNESRKGSLTNITKADTSLEGQLSSLETQLEKLKSDNSAIEDQISELAKPMAEARETKDASLERVKTMVGAPEGAQAEFTATYEEAKANFDEIISEYDGLKNNIKKNDIEIDNTKEEITYVSTKIDINDLSNTIDYKQGDQKIHDSVERKQKLIKEMDLQKELSNPDFY